MVTSGSLLSGEKWHIQLFTETQVGKAIPEKQRIISPHQAIQLKGLIMLIVEDFGL
jgi:hypothetical protein